MVKDSQKKAEVAAPINVPDATGLSAVTGNLPPPEKVERDPNKRVLKVGEKLFLRAVFGRLIHPYQIPVEFNQETATRVAVDDWVVVQYEAGKLAIADED